MAKAKMMWGNILFLGAAIFQLVKEISKANYSFAIWVGIAIGWCAMASAYQIIATDQRRR